MDEEVINDLYSRAKSKGYQKNRDEFVKLLHSDSEVLNDMYSYVKSKGYKKDINSFNSLIGKNEAPTQKKKFASELSSVDGSLESPRSIKPFSDMPTLDQQGLEEAMAKRQSVPTDMSGKPILPKPSKETEKSLNRIKKENEALQSERKKYENVFDKQLTIKPKVEESQYLKDRLSTVDTELINKTEEFVVPELEYQFGDLGFKFEESGALGDYVKVTAPNGQIKEISLDNLFSSKSKVQSEILKQFIKDNTPAKGLFVLEKTMREQDKKFNSQKQVDESIKGITDDVNALNSKQKEFIIKKTQFDKELKKLGPNATKEQLELLEQQKISLNDEMKSLLKEEDRIKQKSGKLSSAVGKYTINKSKQGDWVGGLRNAFLGGIGKLSSSATSLMTDIAGEVNPIVEDGSFLSTFVPALFSNEEATKYALEGAEKLGFGKPKDNSQESINKFKQSLTENQLDEIESYIRDKAKKNVKKEMLPLMRIGTKEIFGDPETTQQWENIKKQDFWGGAILGLAESAPAMIGGAGPAGWAQRTAQMYAQVSDGLAEEMEKNPEFKDVTENEKLAITLPIGITGAILEEFGLRNIKGSQGLINSLTLKALGKAGKGVTAKTFRELVENEVESAIARGALTITAAGAAEFETGAAQELSDTSFKALYNEIKGKKMFDTPESVQDLLENVAVAGAQEAVGGFVLGVPTGVSAAYSEKGFLKMDDVTFETFANMANDDKMQSAFIASLKDKISQGIITTAEGKEQLNNYRNSVGLFRQLPDGLNTRQKKEAMNLLKEKKDLENYVNGKDPALVVKQKNRIAEINDSLTKLTEEDAIQEQSTTEIPVQSETGVSEEVEGRTPEAEPEIVTEQVTQEEVVEEPTIKDSQIPLKRETYEVLNDNGDIITVKVTINKDGSRNIRQEIDGDFAGEERVGKDVTLSNEEYVTKAYGDIQGEPKTQSMEEIMNPKMKEKLTPQQKSELGIEGEVTAPQTIIKEPTIVVHATADERGFALNYFEGIDKTNITTPEDPRGFTRNSTPEQRKEFGKGNAVITVNEISENGDKNISFVSEIEEIGGRAGGTVFDFVVPNGSNATAEGIKDIYDKLRKDLKGEKLINETVKQVKEYIKSSRTQPTNQTQENETEQQPTVQPEPTGDRGRRTDSREIAPLEGTPTIQGATGPDPQLVAVAEQYAADNGIDLKRQSEYVEVDEERAQRIAQAYEEMAHDPQNPKVKEAYAELIKQTIAQYQALVDAGYKFWFMDLNIPSNVEYAESPYNAMRDLRQNKEMGVFPTTDGFGTSELDVNDNPLLAETGFEWPVGGLDGEMKPVLANDLFRAVHDAFGHGLEGSGFRARGEENAWQAHIRLFTGPAKGAITSETRGQNSWLNYGPEGENNRAAKVEDTIFADQKTGLMPEWTWIEGLAGDVEAEAQVAENLSQELSETDLPGYDRTMAEVEGIVQKSKQRKVSEPKIFDNVMNYVMGSKKRRKRINTSLEESN